jgi:hypothetical protein
MNERLGFYLLEFQAEPSRFHRGVRYHWMIFWPTNPANWCPGGMPPLQNWLN